MIDATIKFACICLFLYLIAAVLDWRKKRKMYRETINRLNDRSNVGLREEGF